MGDMRLKWYSVLGILRKYIQLRKRQNQFVNIMDNFYQSSKPEKNNLSIAKSWSSTKKKFV